MDSIDGWSNPPLENMDSHYLLPQVEDQATNGILLQSLPQDSVTFAIGKELLFFKIPVKSTKFKRVQYLNLTKSAYNLESYSNFFNKFPNGSVHYFLLLLLKIIIKNLYQLIPKINWGK